MGFHVQALLGQGCQSLHAIDGHHIGQDILVEREANHVLSTSRHTVALQGMPTMRRPEDFCFAQLLVSRRGRFGGWGRGGGGWGGGGGGGGGGALWEEEAHLLAICVFAAGALRVTALQPSAASSVTCYWTQRWVANLQIAVRPGAILYGDE